MARAVREDGNRRSHRKPSRRRRATFGLVTVSSLLIVGISVVHPASNWLRRRGVPVPHAHLTPSMWVAAWLVVCAFIVVFVAVELTLLAKAIKTVEDPVLHERYKALMLHWPYALMTPYTVIKTLVLPRAFFDANSPAVGSHRVGSQRAIHANSPDDVKAPTAAEEPDPVTIDEYRSALALVIEQIGSLTTDRELLALLLEKYQSLDSPPGGRPPVTDA